MPGFDSRRLKTRKVSSVIFSLRWALFDLPSALLSQMVKCRLNRSTWDCCKDMTSSGRGPCSFMIVATSKKVDTFQLCGIEVSGIYGKPISQ